MEDKKTFSFLCKDGNEKNFTIKKPFMATRIRVSTLYDARPNEEEMRKEKIGADKIILALQEYYKAILAEILIGDSVASNDIDYGDAFNERDAAEAVASFFRQFN